MNFERKTISYKGEIIFERVSMPNTIERAPKVFKNKEACFMFVNDGEFSVRTPEQFIILSKGNSFLSKCYDFFFETNQHQRSCHKNLTLTGILLHQSIIEEIFDFEINDYKYSVDYNSKKVAVNFLLENFRNSIDILLDNPELVDNTMIKTKLKEFVLLLHRAENTPSHLHFLSALFNKNETKFKTTIKNNLYSTLTIDEYAKLCSMSVSSFNRTFKEVFHESPAKYISKKKLEKASKLLLQKNYRISDIAYDCGFDSLSTFNRNFKSQFKISPSEYRLNHI